MPETCAAIVIAAKHGELIKVRDYSGITDTVGALRCKFEFRTNDWDNAKMTAVFCKGNMATNPEIVDGAIGVLLDSIDECAVPAEVLTRDAKYFSVGVWGVTTAGFRIVSKWLVFRIEDGCYVDATEPIEPTPTVYEQIMLSLQSKASIEHTHDERYYTKPEIHNILGSVQPGGSGGGNGTFDHNQLINRDAKNQHPISAIENLQTELDNKQDKGDYIVAEDLETSVDNALAEAKAAGEFDGFSPQINVKTETNYEYILNITQKDGSFDTPNLKGNSGIYVGSGDMPDDCYLQIDTSIEGDSIDVNLPEWAQRPDKPDYNASEIDYENEHLPLPDKTVKAALDTAIDFVMNLEIPDTTGDLENTSGFITNAVNDLANYYLKSETYTQEEINQMISTIPKLSIKVVNTLPQTDIDETAIYLLKDSERNGNLYTEYIYVNGSWEILGSQQMNLDGYAKTDDIPTKISELENDAGFITVDDLPEGGGVVVVETDPTVPDWAKEPKKPDYNASEIAYVNTNVSDPTGTIKAALDEAIGFVVGTVAPSVHTHSNSDTLNNIDNIFVKKDDISTEIESALAEAKASGEFKGDKGDSFTYEDFTSEQLESLKGEDGTSATHEWSGTVLTITSANGTTSADLKGERGNSGVYVGTGDMPADCNIKINPNGIVSKPLPTVTETDNGKFLRVVDGAWTAVNIESAEEVGF